ncbi:hypothetical protein [Lichenihabitans psoromatis]|uniref:hypothetical protein n=1 Tax=Lichenihabitans psoromatis TaxID=2528642 RepID=UPI0010355BA2
MLMWTLLETAKVPGDTAELRLMQRGDEFLIKLDRIDLMGTRMRGSEEALARLGCANLEMVAKPRILIGGLGMGFTLRAVLDLARPAARVEVAELVPAVVTWARGPLASVFGESLDDPRLTLHVADVGAIMRAGLGAYDAILLDVDNGPEGLTRQANDSLYGYAGLRDAFAAVRPGGIVAVWSAGPDRAFTQRLRQTGFEVDEVTVRGHRNRGPRHLIWVATRPLGRPKAIKPAVPTGARAKALTKATKPKRVNKSSNSVD